MKIYTSIKKSIPIVIKDIYRRKQIFNVAVTIVSVSVLLSACGSGNSPSVNLDTPTTQITEVPDISTETKFFEDCRSAAGPKCAAKLYPEVLDQMQLQYDQWEQFGPNSPSANPRQRPVGATFGTASRFNTFVDTVDYFKTNYKLELLLPTLAVISPSSSGSQGSGIIVDNTKIKGWFTDTKLIVSVAHRSEDEEGLGLLSNGWSDSKHKEIIYLYYNGATKAVGLTVPRLDEDVYGLEVLKTADVDPNTPNDKPGFLAISMFPYGFAAMIREIPLKDTESTKYNLMFIAGFETPDDSKRYFSELSDGEANYYGTIIDISPETSGKFYYNQRFHLGQYGPSGYFSKNANAKGNMQTSFKVDFSDSNIGPKIMSMRYLSYGADLKLGIHYTHSVPTKTTDGAFKSGYPFELSGILDSEFNYVLLNKDEIASGLDEFAKIKSLYIKGKYFGPKFEGIGAIYTFQFTNNTVKQDDPAVEYPYLYYWGAMGLYKHKAAVN